MEKCGIYHISDIYCMSKMISCKESSFFPLQQVECSLEEDLSKELIDVTNSGHEIIDKKEIEPNDGDEISETLHALNRQVAELERGTREKKDR